MAAYEGNGRPTKDVVAQGLGWFSVALGAAQLAAPRTLARLIGVKDDDEHSAAMRAVGVREVATGVGILARPRPAGWLWGRVVGDAIDLALLAKADTKDRGRTVVAIAAVAGVTVPDVLESARLTRAHDESSEVSVTKTITVRKPAQEVYGFWREFENFPRFMAHVESVSAMRLRSHWVAKAPGGTTVEWDAEIVDDQPGVAIQWRSLPEADVANWGTVRFVPATGDRGTEVRVVLGYRPPAGKLGATIAKLFGEEPATQLADDLRRFKQVLETGEVVVSEGSPRGHELRQQLKQRPAQPIGEEVAA
jgi:uncharacterized membrane protein